MTVKIETPEPKRRHHESGWRALPYHADGQLLVDAFVVLALVALAIVHLRFAVQHSFPIPFWDESGYIPVATGSESFTFRWLWSPNNEHRIVLPRLIYLVIARISRMDARVMNAVNVGMLIATCCIILIAVRKLNGNLQYSDAVIPFALLSQGQYPNTIWPFQVQFVLPACLACVTAALLIFPGTGAERRYVWLGPAILAMCLCGANGLLVGLPLLPVLFWIALRSWRAGKKVQAASAGLFGLATTVYTALYFVGLERPVLQRSRPFVLAQGLVEAVKACALFVGPAAADLWPYSGVAAVLTIAASMLLLAWKLWTCPASRLSADGLLLAFGGFLGLAVAIGCGRTVMGPNAGFAPRYALLFTPMLLAVLLTFDRFAARATVAFVRISLLVVLSVLYWPNGRQTVTILEAQLVDAHALEQQVAGNVPISKLAEDFGSRWMFTPAQFAQNMQMLARARMAIYRDHTPPTETGNLLAELAMGTEVRGPSTSGKLFALREYKLPGTLGLIAHAPHRASVPIHQVLHAFHVAFGILPIAATDGVKFQVLLRKQSGLSVVLWSRELDPLHSSRDTGLQQADITLSEPAGETDRLVFQTTPIKDPYACWSYWTDLRFQ